MKRVLPTPALALLLVLLLISACPASELPEPRGFVNDYTGRVDRASLETLAAKAAELKSGKDLEVGIAVIGTTGGAPIEQYALQLARKWGVGSKDSNRGVLIVVALDDRTSRIEVSRHFEGVLTDGQAGSILRSARPDFKGGDYGAGLVKIVEGVAAIADAPPAEPATVKAGEPGGMWALLFVLAVGVAMLVVVALPFAGLVVLIIWLGSRAMAKGWGGGQHAPATSIFAATADSSTDSSSTPEPSPASDYVSSTSETSYSSESSSSSDSGSSFGGSSDFGGGGASDRW